MKEVEKKLTDKEKLELIIESREKYGYCHVDIVGDVLSTDSSACSIGNTDSKCPIEKECDNNDERAISELAKQKLAELEEKPKFQLGRKVRCKEHGTEFVIERYFKAFEGEWIYSDNNIKGTNHKGCDDKKHLVGNFNCKCVPESQLELVEELGWTEFPINMEVFRVFRTEVECTFMKVGKPKKQNIFQKLFKRRKCMNKVIANLYDKTKDAILVEKHFDGYFSNPIIGILAENSKDRILEEAKKEEEEDKSAE